MSEFIEPAEAVDQLSALVDEIRLTRGEAALGIMSRFVHDCRIVIAGVQAWQMREARTLTTAAFIGWHGEATTRGAMRRLERHLLDALKHQRIMDALLEKEDAGG